MKYFYALVLFSVSYYNAFALDLDKYQAGTFFSVLVDIDSGEVFYAPTQGAAYIDGTPLPRNEIVDRYGGHAEIRDMNNIDLQIREVYAGGVLVGEDGKHTVKFKSISVNGSRTTDYLVPSLYRYYFSEVIADLIQGDVYFNGEKIEYNPKPNVCNSIYLPVKIPN